MITRSAYTATLSFLISLALTGCATSSVRQEQATRATEADKLLQTTMETNHLPSLSAVVSIDGQVVYKNALGLANIEAGTQATPETVYAQGSVTKTLTAVAALMLAEKNRLDLDAPVQRYCAAYPTKQEAITLRQLLSHTAGVRHYNYRQFEKDFLNHITYKTIHDALVKFKDDPLVANPGEKYHYSSWGYVVVACAIEGASGKKFNEFVTQRVLEPSGMSHSLMDTPNLVLTSRATGYHLEDNGTLEVTGVLNPSDRSGASGLLSTPTDMARFTNALLNGKLIGREALEMMWSPQTLGNGESTGHALGWDIDQPANAVSKGGATYDATSYLYITPSNRLVVAISTNLTLWDDGRAELAKELARVFSAIP